MFHLVSFRRMANKLGPQALTPPLPPSQGHANVLPVGDLGVRRGMQVFFSLRDLPTPAEMEALTAHWAPYRSIGR